MYCTLKSQVNQVIIIKLQVKLQAHTLNFCITVYCTVTLKFDQRIWTEMDLRKILLQPDFKTLPNVDTICKKYVGFRWSLLDFFLVFFQSRLSKICLNLPNWLV